MVINGNSRSNASFFAKHLMKAEDNERVEVKEIRGLMAQDVQEALLEMRMIAAGTGAKNAFYHANLNPCEDEQLTPEQWTIAVDTLEKNLGLEGHARFIVEHEKNGRTHQHVIFSRVNPETMTIASDSFNYRVHTETARELEQMFQHEPVAVPPLPERDRFQNYETFKASQGRSVDPREMKAEITELWQQSDSGIAFQAAVEEKGYLLARGDRRDFVVIDDTGHIHSLGRRIEGSKAADIRAKMSDLDPSTLMGAQEASAWMKGKDEAETSGSSDKRSLPEEQAQEVSAPSTESERPFAIVTADEIFPPQTVLRGELPAHLRAMLPPDHPLLSPSQEYVRVNSPEEAVAVWKENLRHRAKTWTAADWTRDVDAQREGWDAMTKWIEAAENTPEPEVEAVHQVTRTDGRSMTTEPAPPQSWQEMIDKHQQPQYEKKGEPELER